MSQEQIGDENNPQEAGEKSEEEMMKGFLEGIGFTEKEGKEGCFQKEVTLEDESYRVYWDFRKGAPYFYAYKSGESKPVLKKEHEQFEEHRLFSEKFNLKAKQKVEQKPQQKTPVPEKTDAAIVVRDDNQAHDIMNLKDDNQVLAEMEGKYLEEFVYSFTVDGGKRNVTGLSWAGVKEVVRSAGNIEVEDLKITETDKTYRVLAKGRDTIRNVSMFGIAEQSKMMRLKSGDLVEDMHSLSKCVSRAQRNALRVLIPEATIKMTIEKYLEEKKRRPER